ncbi:putative transcription factor MYB/SANT family [Helianthus debilis subsp. tardiflorus]
MKWDSGSWMVEGGLPIKSTIWTPVENKLFENALAKYDKDTPDRWQKVAEMVPGKTVADVKRQYKELEDDVSSIEAGLSPKYRYNHNINNNSPFTLEWGDGHECKSPPYGGGGTLSPVAVVAAGRPVEQERKKGVPWTEEEHKLFLLGLKKYGKGDWRNISRNYVVTRTPTQVASHAQKYFIRQLSGGKDKRRASIHDITTVNVNESQPPLPKNKRTSPEQCKFQWNQPNDGRGGGGGVAAAINQMNGNVFMGSQYRGNIGFRSGGGGVSELYGVPQSMSFQMQPAMHYPHG